MFPNVFSSLDKYVGNAEIKAVLWSLIIIAIMLLLKWFIARYLNSKNLSMRDKLVWKQTTSLGVSLVSVVLIALIWLEWFHSFFTMLSLVAAAITIVSKEILLNVFSYGMLIWRDAFQVGDRIKIGSVTGDVVEMGMVYFTLVEVGQGVLNHPVGSVVKVPNSRAMIEPIHNFSRGVPVVWHETVIEFDFSSNISAVRQMCLNILESHTYEFSHEDIDKIKKENVEPIFERTKPAFFVKPIHGCYEASLRFATPYQEVRGVEQKIVQQIILEVEGREDIAFYSVPH